MSVKNDVDFAAIAKRMDSNNRKAQIWLDTAIIRDTNPFVPFDTGMLATSPIKATEPGSGLIVYNQVYAERLYHGESLNFSTDKHPKATHHWFEKAKSVYLGRWLAGVAKILGRG